MTTPSGVSASRFPEAADDEAPSRYRARLFNRLATRLPSDHDLAQLRADDLGSQPIVFDNFEAELIKLRRLKANGQAPIICPMTDRSSRDTAPTTWGSASQSFMVGARSLLTWADRVGRSSALLIARPAKPFGADPFDRA